MNPPANRATLPFAADGGLQAYINTVYQVPVLEREEESELVLRFEEHGDLEAARHLVTAHLRYVVYIARSYRGYGFLLEDLIQQGNIGLMKSVRRFQRGYGVRLITFAVHWIKAEIHEYLLRNWRIVKVATTKAQRKLFFGLRKAKKRLGPLNRQEAEQIARDLKVKASEVLEMDQRLIRNDASFDLPVGQDESETALAPVAYLKAQDEDPARLVAETEAAEYQSAALRQALADLDPRSLDIVRSRWLGETKASLKELAGKYGVSLERIRQIEVKALARMKKVIDS